MSRYLSLDELGQRICIIGPSNSGKSTLANAIACKQGLPLVHLDQFYHQPHSHWVPRASGEFLQLHQEAIGQETWVMEGNYSSCIHPRLERATGLVLLTVPRSIAFYRYLIRCYSSKPRIGGLGVQGEALSWEMLKHILYHSPKNYLRYLALFEQATIPKLLLISPHEVKAYCERWERDQPKP